jgi:hypothetical protein
MYYGQQDIKQRGHTEDPRRKAAKQTERAIKPPVICLGYRCFPAVLLLQHSGFTGRHFFSVNSGLLHAPLMPILQATYLSVW